MYLLIVVYRTVLHVFRHFQDVAFPSASRLHSGKLSLYPHSLLWICSKILSGSEVFNIVKVMIMSKISDSRGQPRMRLARKVFADFQFINTVSILVLKVISGF